VGVKVLAGAMRDLAGDRLLRVAEQDAAAVDEVHGESSND